MSVVFSNIEVIISLVRGALDSFLYKLNGNGLKRKGGSKEGVSLRGKLPDIFSTSPSLQSLMGRGKGHF